MLSDFVKKLLFTRKFYFNNGSIEVMDRKKIMLPASVVYELQNGKNSERMAALFKEEFHEIANHFGSKRQDLVKNLAGIFDMYGLGKLEIGEINLNKQTALVNIYNSTLALSKQSNDKCHLTQQMLKGIFMFIFDCEVSVVEESCYSVGDEYCTFKIKKEGDCK